MARKRRARRPGAHLSQPEIEGPQWRWRTLPVWLAFTGGFLVGWYAYLLGSGTDAGIGATLVFFIVIFGFSLGLSRITSYSVNRWRLRRARERAAALAPPSRRQKEPRTPL